MTAPADPLDRVRLLVPRGAPVRQLLAARPMLPFSPDVLSFIQQLGRSLRGDGAVRRHPELVALGFWARASTIERLRARFAAAYPEAVRLPRGVAFHIAPANVDTIFVYSLLLSMLAGNVNIVRVSSRASEQADLLMQRFAAALEEAPPAVAAANAIVRYEHDRAITDALSAAADLRVVWGGDATVRLIRESPLAPAGTELVFPNKFSCAVIDAAAWLAAPDQASLARAFVNDALWFGQAACSSPRALVWRGSRDAARAASAVFWAAVDAAAAGAGFAWEGADAVAKLLAEQGIAIEEAVEIRAMASNRVRVVSGDLAALIRPIEAANGFFREARVDVLAELTALAAADWQTVVSYGIGAGEWREALAQGLPQGIDRIVPIGTALDFDAIWDGKDLLGAMTRLTTVRVD